MVEFADGAEIGCAEERHPVVLAPVELAAAGSWKRKPGEAGIVGQLARGRIRRHVEIGVVVDDLARLALLHHVHARGLLEIASQMEERDGKLARPVGPQGQIGLELDLAVGVVIDLLQDFGRGARRRHIGHRRHVARLLFQRLVGKRRGSPIFRPCWARAGAENPDAARPAVAAANWKNWRRSNMKRASDL